MRVELDIYSGRPNPAWTLTAEQEGDFRGLLARLRAAGFAPAGVPTPDLGYRGLLVTGLAAADGRRPAAGDAVLVRGVVVLWRDAGLLVADPDRAAERFLARTGRGVAADRVLDLLEAGTLE